MQRVFQMSVILVKTEKLLHSAEKTTTFVLWNYVAWEEETTCFCQGNCKNLLKDSAAWEKDCIRKLTLISPQEGGCPAPCIKACRYLKCLKKSIKFFGEVFHILLELITQQSRIKSAEKANAQCISNEAFLIAIL